MSDPSSHEMSDDDKRRDQLLRAAESTEADAAPRITVSERDGTTRVDIADSAAVRPGPGPGIDTADASTSSQD